MSRWLAICPDIVHDEKAVSVLGDVHIRTKLMLLDNGIHHELIDSEKRSLYLFNNDLRFLDIISIYHDRFEESLGAWRISSLLRLAFQPTVIGSKLLLLVVLGLGWVFCEITKRKCLLNWLDFVLTYWKTIYLCLVHLLFQWCQFWLIQ